jgi:hypothetical protein
LQVTPATNRWGEEAQARKLDKSQGLLHKHFFWKHGRMIKHNLHQFGLASLIQKFDSQCSFRVFGWVGPPDLRAGLHQYLIPRLAFCIRAEG